MSAWKNLQLLFTTKVKNCNKEKRVKWAEKLEEVRYFVKEKDLVDIENTEKYQIDVESEKNNRNKSSKPSKPNDQISAPQEIASLKLTTEMVRLALYRNGGSNAEKNWKKLFKLVSSGVQDDRINEIMASEWD